METGKKGEMNGRRKEKIKERGQRERERDFAHCSKDSRQKQVLLGYSERFLIGDLTTQ